MDGNILFTALLALLVRGLLLVRSIVFNRRRLELVTYPLWNTNLAFALARAQITTCLIAPQYPVWTSPNDYTPAANPNDSILTQADSAARGVNVDFAIVLPFVTPTPANNPPAGSSVAMQASPFVMHAVFVPVLVELKKPPTRHPANLAAYCEQIDALLDSAKEQAIQQALCLFTCVRYGEQDEVILVAGAGDFWVMTRVNRNWAEIFLDGLPWSPKDLIDPEAEEEEDFEEERVVETVADMMLNPSACKKRAIARRKLEQERHERATRRADDKANAAAAAAAATPPPMYDRTAEVFSDEALKEHKGRRFLEHVAPELIFGKPADPDNFDSLQWSRVLRMGTTISYQYEDYICEFIKGLQQRGPA